MNNREYFIQGTIEERSAWWQWLLWTVKAETCCSNSDDTNVASTTIELEVFIVWFGVMRFLVWCCSVSYSIFSQHWRDRVKPWKESGDIKRANKDPGSTSYSLTDVDEIRLKRPRIPKSGCKHGIHDNKEAFIRIIIVCHPFSRQVQRQKWTRNFRKLSLNTSTSIPRSTLSGSQKQWRKSRIDRDIKCSSSSQDVADSKIGQDSFYFSSARWTPRWYS